MDVMGFSYQYAPGSACDVNPHLGRDEMNKNIKAKQH